MKGRKRRTLHFARLSSNVLRHERQEETWSQDSPRLFFQSL
jgi:hypothetical protein